MPQLCDERPKLQLSKAMQMKKSLLVVFLLAFAISGCELRRSVVEGRLLALGTDTPLPKVTLRIAGKSDTVTALTITDADGKFLFDRLRSNETYRIVSADTTKFLVSPVEVTLAKGEKKQTTGTLRGIVSPPKPGLWAWIRGTWRELSALRTGRTLQMLRSVVDQAQMVPQSASLVAWFPGKYWGGDSDSSIQWVGGMLQDSLVRFTEIALNENTPDGEPVAMDPTTFDNWSYFGVFPVRGPDRPGLYAVVIRESERSDPIVYPFWVPSGGSALNTQQPASVTSNFAGSITGGFGGIGNLDTNAIFQRALQAAMQALSMRSDSLLGKIGSPDTNPNTVLSGVGNVHSADGKYFTSEQAERWRQQLRLAMTDRDTFRRRQLWRAIRDSAEGSDIALDADRLLMRDLNGLPLK
ncbi:MAG: carboxypeptidase-like regulatory domain-containing protein [bacterium]|nr:carboxypeptidase-like regulatory domain-containing protein [bacterium]